MNVDAIKPNFLVAGVAKSGTTSLYYYLKQHPDIFLPRKETFFFISEIYKSINPSDPARRKKEDLIFSFDDYLELYKNAGRKRAVGEIGTGYMYFHDTAIPQIKKYLGDVKIVIMLRNPVDRAFSSYTHFSRDLYDNFTFETSLNKEKERIALHWDFMWYYIDLGFYYKQVKSYIDNFSSVKVYLYDDFSKDSIGLVKDLYKFLEVDWEFTPHVEIKYNASGSIKNRTLQKLIVQPNAIKRAMKPFINLFLSKEARLEVKQKLKSMNVSSRAEIEKETRERLQNLYKTDIIALQDLIHKDLSSWLI